MEKTYYCENHNLLQAVLDSTSAIIYVKNLSGEYIFINRQYEQFLHTTNKLVQGKTAYDFFPQEIADRFSSIEHSVIQSEKSLKTEEDIQQEDGMHTYITNIVPLCDSNGKIYGVTGITTDVTELRKVELSQKELSGNFSKIFLESPAASIITAIKDGKIIDVNKSFLQWYGWEDIIGKTTLELKIWLTELDRNKIIAQVLEQKSIKNLEIKLRTYIGSIKDVLISCELIDLKGNTYLLTTLLDITERKQAVIKLQQLNEDLEQRVKERTEEFKIVNQQLLYELNERYRTEAEYQTFVRTSIDGFWMMDIFGKFLEVNDAYCKMVGYSHTELLTMKVFDIEVSENVEETQQHINQVLKVGHDNFETLHRCKNGNIINVEVSVNYMKDTNKFFVFLRDITERKRTEKELLKLRLGAERAAEVFFVTNKEGVINYVNPAFEKLYGYTAKEAFGQTPRILKSGVYSEENYRLFWDMLLRKEIVAGEIINKTKAGQLLNIENSANPILDKTGNIIGFLAVQRDITDRKEAEKLLQKEKDFVSAILDTTGALVVVLDKEGRIIRFNNTCEKTTGYSFDEVKGKFVWDIFIIEREIESVKSIFKTLRSGSFPNTHENYWKTKEGKLRLIAWSNTVLTDLENNVEHVIGTGLDITERKKTEEKLKETNKDLNTFIYKSSHDLRGPIASILGLLNLAGKEVNDKAASSYFDMMSTSAQKLNKVLLGLIETMEIKENPLTLSEINFQTIIQQAVKELENTEDFTRMDFSINISKHQPFCSDTRMLFSVFKNILSNSIKYQNHALNNPCVSIAITDYEDGVKIIIADNGIGIPAAVQNKIFDMFYRGSNISNGSGLGLYMVKNTIERLSGTLKLKSRENQGTTFTIILPSSCPLSVK